VKFQGASLKTIETFHEFRKTLLCIFFPKVIKPLLTFGKIRFCCNIRFVVNDSMKVSCLVLCIYIIIFV